MTDARYLKALRFDAFTPFYGVISRLLLPETTFKQRLIDQSSIQSGQRVLDVGCGTATLAVMIKIRYPEVRVIGLDGDPKILKLAHQKISARKVEVALTLGLSSTLLGSVDHGRRCRAEVRRCRCCNCASRRFAFVTSAYRILPELRGARESTFTLPWFPGSKPA